jgi:hypothetical protein
MPTTSRAQAATGLSSVNVREITLVISAAAGPTLNSDDQQRAARYDALMTRTLLAFSFGALALGTPASAHHSFAAAYFEDQRVSVAGEVTQFDYVNPHAWVHVMAPDQNGEMQKFSAEWSNPRRLQQQGLTASAIKPGDQVIITGSPGRNPAERKIHLRAIERPADGWKWPQQRPRR